ncbi:MAG: phenylalanine--tRNA ligase subunit beta, partial [Aestuariibaculum sp.]
TGNKTSENWTIASEKTNFFYLKGIVINILERLGLIRYNEKPITNRLFSEGLTLEIGKNKLVEFGLIKKNILKHFNITQEVLFANFNWDAILSILKHNRVNFAPIPKYPEVRRDFALLIDDKVTFESIYKIAKQTEKQLLKSINLFDVYQGKNLPNGKKSYAVSFTLQDENKTLNDKQIDKIMSKLQTNFEKQLGAELR